MSGSAAACGKEDKPLMSVTDWSGNIDSAVTGVMLGSFGRGAGGGGGVDAVLAAVRCSLIALFCP